ncbi:MAG: type II secretion system protein GspG [Candidatus Poribacteria bacterium]|nr:type II secretion system protein GspG [Candidatus Poribacteria bacterium]
MKQAVQGVILVIVAAALGALIVPPFMELRHADDAILALETISDAAQRYAYHTGTTCPDPNALLTNPGVENWRGPYLEEADALNTPWGGRYVFDQERGLVGIAATNADAPERYRLGGIAELSLPITQDPQWWTRDAVQR